VEERSVFVAVGNSGTRMQFVRHDGFVPKFFEPYLAGTSGWLAPEIINPSHNDGEMPVIESKAADVFAFAMLALEAFTGDVPFVGQTPTTAASRVLQGERPEIPQNAQEIGLTGEMWKLLESCWYQDPEKRPTVRKVIKRWRKFVARENGKMIAGARTSSEISPLASRDKFGRTPPAAGPSRSQPRDNRSVTGALRFGKRLLWRLPALMKTYIPARNR